MDGSTPMSEDIHNLNLLISVDEGSVVDRSPPMSEDKHDLDLLTTVACIAYHLEFNLICTTFYDVFDVMIGRIIVHSLSVVSYFRDGCMLRCYIGD